MCLQTRTRHRSKFSPTSPRPLIPRTSRWCLMPSSSPSSMTRCVAVVCCKHTTPHVLCLLCVCACARVCVFVCTALLYHKNTKPSFLCWAFCVAFHVLLAVFRLPPHTLSSLAWLLADPKIKAQQLSCIIYSEVSIKTVS